jgi:hypothetical protein
MMALRRFLFRLLYSLLIVITAPILFVALIPQGLILDFASTCAAVWRELRLTWTGPSRPPSTIVRIHKGGRVVGAYPRKGGRP